MEVMEFECDFDLGVPCVSCGSEIIRINLADDTVICDDCKAFIGNIKPYERKNISDSTNTIKIKMDLTGIDVKKIVGIK